MKLWHWVALLMGVGIVYVLVKRPTVPAGGIYPATSNDTNNTLGALFRFGTSLVNKIGAPSAAVGTVGAPASTDYFTSDAAAADVFKVEPYNPANSSLAADYQRGY